VHQQDLLLDQVLLKQHNSAKHKPKTARLDTSATGAKASSGI
jgi:hypothetical protein